jgi:hypothetical protein
MEKVVIRAVIKYLYRKGCPTRKSMKTSWIHLGSTAKKWAAKYKRGRESI